MVGQAEIGVPRSSMYCSSLSSHTLRSTVSSISYNLPRLSCFCFGLYKSCGT